MYKPPHPVRHQLPVWSPTSREQAGASKLFSPLTLRSGMTLHNRGWVPAMVPWRASPDGDVTDEVLAWYERFARGKPGAIVVEATGIRDIPSGPLLRISNDGFIAGLAELVATVRRASEGQTRLLIQVIDFLRIKRRPQRERYLAEFLAISEHHRLGLAELSFDEAWMTASEAEVRARLQSLSDAELLCVLSDREQESLRFGFRERVTDMHLPAVRELPEVLPGLFAAASERAAAAGFDGVELHYAHAYTMASFLSATNTRQDGYGTSREGRARLPCEVLGAVRARVGERFTVGARILADEIIAGGSRVLDACYFALRLADEGLDVLSLSMGGKFEDAKQPKPGEAAYPYTGESGFECMPPTFSDARGPFSRNLHTQAHVTRALRDAGHELPVVVAGGISGFAAAEAALSRGDGDLVGCARQSLADPDWWEKLRQGRSEEIRRCLFSNYCEALDQKHKQVTCQLWDRAELQPEEPRSHCGKRRLVAPPWS